jgi:PII-like signaling protein
VSHDCLKLTAYFGERDRIGPRFLAGELIDIYARHGLQTSLVMRGVTGFGPSQTIHTDRLLTLSEDLPLVAVAVDTRQRVQAALAEVKELRFNGLVTLERARMLTHRTEAVRVPWADQAETKLTVYVGRHERIDGAQAHEAVVAYLHEHGVVGATVLLGVDGTVHGVRERAKFFGRNASVPLMVIAVGDTRRITALASGLTIMLPRPLLTLERIRVCKRDGEKLAEPRHLPETDASGLGVWQKLMVYTGEQAQVGGEPLHQALIRRLRAAGAAGATSLRGIWGYYGNHAPHGDSFWQLRRHVPVLTVIVDNPVRIRRWFAIVDALTEATGLVTSEMVPARRAIAPNGARGSFRLAGALP